MVRGSAGSVATRSDQRSGNALGEPLAPGAALREAEERAAAARTDLLIVLGALIHLVRETELLLDDRQITHHHGRRIRLTASPAARLLRALPRILVEGHPDLSRALEDVEQLPK